MRSINYYLEELEKLNVKLDSNFEQFLFEYAYKTTTESKKTERRGENIKTLIQYKLKNLCIIMDSIRRTKNLGQIYIKTPDYNTIDKIIECEREEGVDGLIDIIGPLLVKKTI